MTDVDYSSSVCKEIGKLKHALGIELNHYHASKDHFESPEKCPNVLPMVLRLPGKCFVTIDK